MGILIACFMIKWLWFNRFNKHVNYCQNNKIIDMHAHSLRLTDDRAKVWLAHTHTHSVWKNLRHPIRLICIHTFYSIGILERLHNQELTESETLIRFFHIDCHMASPSSALINTNDYFIVLFAWFSPALSLLSFFYFQCVNSPKTVLPITDCEYSVPPAHDCLTSSALIDRKHKMIGKQFDSIVFGAIDSVIVFTVFRHLRFECIAFWSWNRFNICQSF